jgi:hypothetical protein
MQKNVQKLNNMFLWILLVLLNFFAAIIFVLLLTNIPNPLPLLLVLLFYAAEAYYFKNSKAKLLVATISMILTIWLLVDTNGTIAVGQKCSPELNKIPLESRDSIKTQQEEENFEDCSNSMTLVDYLNYGLIK